MRLCDFHLSWGTSRSLLPFVSHLGSSHELLLLCAFPPHLIPELSPFCSLGVSKCIPSYREPSCTSQSWKGSPPLCPSRLQCKFLITFMFSPPYCDIEGMDKVIQLFFKIKYFLRVYHMACIGPLHAYMSRAWHIGESQYICS